MFLHKSVYRWGTGNQFSRQGFGLDILAPIGKDLRQLIRSHIPGLYAIFDIEVCIFTLGLDVTDNFTCQTFSFQLRADDRVQRPR